MARFRNCVSCVSPEPRALGLWHDHTNRCPSPNSACHRLVRRHCDRSHIHRRHRSRSCRRRSASAWPARRPSRPPGSPPRICGSMRTGRQQSVAVDVRQATASLRSGHYMKLGDGESRAMRATRIMGVYPTKDGRWSYLHCNFPNHRAAALQRAGRGRKTATRSRKAVSNWNAARPGGGDHRRQGAGGMVRTHGRMGEASASRRHRLAAADGDRADRRQRRRSLCPPATARCRASACST